MEYHAAAVALLLANVAAGRIAAAIPALMSTPDVTYIVCLTDWGSLADITTGLTDWSVAFAVMGCPGRNVGAGIPCNLQLGSVASVDAQSVSMRRLCEHSWR